MSERTYAICVVRPKRGWRGIRYPPAPLDVALRTARVLEGRGFSVTALTEANGISEHLSVSDLELLVI